MTQLHKFGGKVVVPLTDHIGFGIPADGGDESSTGPRLIASAGDPNGLPAPAGSIALDYLTPATWMKTAVGTVWVLSGSSSVDTMFEQMQSTQIGEIQPNANIAAGDTSGTGLLLGNNIQADGGSSSGVDIDGKFALLNKSNIQPEVYIVASANNISPSINPVSAPNLLPLFGLKLKMTQLISARYFIGQSSQLTLADVPFIGTDTPASDYIGFQFSGAGLRGDVNWQLARDGSALGGSQTLVDTGVLAAAGTALNFVINWITDSSVQCLIYDANYDTSAPLFDSGVLTTDLIAPTRGLRVGVTSQYLTAGTIPMWQFYKMSLMNRNGSLV